MILRLPSATRFSNNGDCLRIFICSITLRSIARDSRLSPLLLRARATAGQMLAKISGSPVSGLLAHSPIAPLTAPHLSCPSRMRKN